MARSENNLNAVLQDTANAIRAKKSSTNEICPRDFADEISTIETGIEPTGTKEISANGNQINIREYEYVDVNVPNPSTGTLNITSNNVYDVTNYASANVNVPNPSIGTYYITENSTYDVRNYAYVNVQVSGGPSASSTIPAWVPYLEGTTSGLNILFDGLEARHDSNGDIYFCHINSTSYVVDIDFMIANGFKLPFAFNTDDSYTSIMNIGELVVNVTVSDEGPGGRASEDALRDYFGDSYDSIFGAYHTLRDMYGRELGQVLLSVMTAC